MSTDTETTYSFDDIIARERDDEDHLLSCVANFQEAAHAYREVSDDLETKASGKALGSAEEISSANETLRRSFHHALEELSEQDITKAQELGHMSEEDAAFARKFKRLMELEQMRESQSREVDRGRDDLDRDQ